MPSPHPLIRNTIWMLGGFGARTVLQALYFILIARALGPTQYGAFVAVSAIVAILAPFASWGSGNLLIKHVARDRSTFNKYWGAALAFLLISSVLMTLLVLATHRVFLSGMLPILLVLSIAVTDLVFARLTDLCSQAFQAVEKLSRTAQIQAAPSITRLAAAVLLFALPLTPNALTWSLLHLVSTALAALLALYWVKRELGWGPLTPRPLLGELREGFYFALSLSSQSIYNDIDKTMLARLASLDAAGIYAAAYRVIDAAFSPVRAVLYASYARFFKSGQEGMKGSLAWALKLAPFAAAYGLLASLGLWLAAPLLPRVLGADFAATASALQWLAPLLLLKTLHYFAADTLTGAGLQGTRTAVQVAVAVLNVLLNLWLLPTYGWLGATWASLASDALLAIMLWSLVASRTREVKHVVRA